MSLKKLPWLSCLSYRNSVDIGSLFIDRRDKPQRLIRALMIWYRYYGLEIGDKDKDSMLESLLGISPSFRLPIFTLDGSTKSPYWGVAFNSNHYWLHQGKFFLRLRCDDGVAPSEARCFLLYLGNILLSPSLDG